MLMTTPPADRLPNIEQILAARRRIAAAIRTTPVLSEPRADRELGCELWLKCENLQRAGAFKFRGASNAVALLGEKGRDGDVATHSSGNHGAALALAASTHGRGCHVVMPHDSVTIKVDAVRRYGGEVVFCEPTPQGRADGLSRLVADGCIPVHPYDDADIICGQGTATLEIVEQCPRPDIILTPVGGGGLISGTAIAAKALLPGISVIGAEPAGAGDTALSIKRGERVTAFPVDTMADGLRAIVGVLNFRIIQDNVDHVLTVSENGIVEAMAFVWRHFRIMIEPSSATVVAAVREYRDQFQGRRVAAVVSGGNLDPRRLPFEP